MQDSPLFALSVAGQHRLGATGPEFPRNHRSARIAQCHDFIMHLPQQYDTVFGDAVANLVRRSAPAPVRDCARRHPPGPHHQFLTSQPLAGRKNGSEVSAALDHLSDKSTTFCSSLTIFSQRKTLDLVLFLSEGRIVERGTHHA